MKKSISVMMSSLLGVCVVGSIIPMNVAYAEEKVYLQTASELQAKITSKIDKMEVSNSTKESDFYSKIDSSIRDSSEYYVEILDYDREKATRDDSGLIEFDVSIVDREDVETLFHINKVINTLGTYVYLRLPELGDKYITVTDSAILEQVKSGLTLSSKYVTTTDQLSVEKLMEPGWQTIDNGVYYVDGNNGVKKGWCEIDGAQYHLDEKTGKARTLWELYNGKWYFMNRAGVLLTGFQTIDDVPYYFRPAQTATGTVHYTSDTTFYPSMGAMLTGWQRIDNNWYLFGGSGDMKKGWQKVGSVWYYFDDNGVMAYNTEIDGYTLSESGALV